jgi:hypothetical protein
MTIVAIFYFGSISESLSQQYSREFALFALTNGMPHLHTALAGIALDDRIRILGFGIN